MTHLWNEYLATLPASLREWMRGLLPLLQILLIAIGAVLLQRLLRRVTNRVAERYRLPAEFNFITRRLLTFVVYGSCWRWSAWAYRARCSGAPSLALPPWPPWPFLPRGVCCPTFFVRC